VFLHVEEYPPPEIEHPCHGALPDMKLVAQPPTQLPVTLASLASLADIGDVEGAAAVGDVRGDTVLRAIVRGSRFCGLADCFGAWTTTAGSEEVPPSEVVAASEPLRPQSSSPIEEKATARLVTERDQSVLRAQCTKAKCRPIAERSSSHMVQSETAPVKGPLGLIPITVAALFDDYRPVAAVSVPAAIPAAMEAAVVVTELGACTAKVITIAEPDPIAVATDADADAEIFSAGYGRCRNGNSRQGCKRKTEFSHVPSSSRNCPRQNGGTESLFLRSGRGFNEQSFMQL
jgi:hypothetical protein